MKHSILFCFLITFLSCSEKETYSFEVVNEDDGFLPSQPISIDVKQLGFLDLDFEKEFLLLKKEGDKSIPIPFQVDGDEKLWFVADTENASYYFEKMERDISKSKKMSFEQKNGNLVISKEDQALLVYRYGMSYPPEGIDSIFKKSGYIHPIMTPNGDTLSRIQPPDHYHHYGIWGPWTHTQINGKRVDFWNIGDRQGTVLFKEFVSTTSGTMYSSFEVLQEHIDFITEKEPQVALNENLKVRLWNLNRPDRYMIDYSSNFSTPLESGVLFEAYRYGGGIGMRFTERWHKDNCTVLTSEGKDRLTADGTKARWCIVSGESSDGQGTNGILFMSHTENKSHPEPMRVWPIDANDGRGDMFFEFCPIRYEEWEIESGKDYQLKYRMIVFEGTITAEEAEAYWQSFVGNSQIKILNN